MDVTGHWRRSALGAGGVALLLPLGLALGVALTTAFGGAATLRALGQVFAGPSAPGVRGGPAAPGLESVKDVPSIPVRLHPDRVRQSTPAGGPAPSTSTGQRPSTQAPGAPTTPGSGKPTPAPAPTTPASGGNPTPTPTPTPQPSAVHQAGEQAVGIAKSLPDPVGGVAGDAVQTVVDLIP